MTITPESLERQDALKRWAGRGALVAILVGLVFLGRSRLPAAYKGIAHWRASSRLTAAGALVTSDFQDVLWSRRTATTAVYASHSPRIRTAIDDRILVYVRDLENVESIDLNNCDRITDDGLVAFEKLTTLKRLDLGCDIQSSRITDAGLDHLKGLTSLTSLGLAGRQITDAGLARLAGLKNLEELDLEGTAVTDASLPLLKTLFPNLKIVMLAGTKVSRQALWNLLQANHTLEIHDGAEMDAMRNQFEGGVDGK